MAIIEHELTGPPLLDGIDASTLEVQTPQELVSDANGLSRLHTEAFLRARPNEDGTGTLIHEDDESFRFVVGYFEKGQFIKLADDGVDTLAYTIQDDKVFQHVSIDDAFLTEKGADITDKSLEIAALANVIRRST